MLYDYSITSFMVLAGLVTSEILMFFVMAAVAIFLLWMFFALVFSLEHRFYKRLLKMIKYLKKTDKNLINLDVLDKHAKKTTKGFYAGWKNFKSSYHGKPSDFIKRCEALDPEVNGGAYSHGKSFMNAFINLVVILTTLFVFLLNGGSETITFSLLVEIMVMPLCVLFVLKILYYLYVSLKHQLYTNDVDVFYELLDLMDEKLDKGESGFMTSSDLNENGDFGTQTSSSDNLILGQDENGLADGQNSELANEDAEEKNPLEKYDIFKKKNIDVSKLINEVPKSSNESPYINVDSSYVIKDDDRASGKISTIDMSDLNFGESDKNNSSEFIDIEKPIAEIDQEKLEKINDAVLNEQTENNDENGEQIQDEQTMHESTVEDENNNKDVEISNEVSEDDGKTQELDEELEQNSDSVLSLDDFEIKENSDSSDFETQAQPKENQDDESSDAQDVSLENSKEIDNDAKPEDLGLKESSESVTNTQSSSDEEGQTKSQEISGEEEDLKLQENPIKEANLEPQQNPITEEKLESQENFDHEEKSNTQEIVEMDEKPNTQEIVEMDEMPNIQEIAQVEEKIDTQEKLESEENLTAEPQQNSIDNEIQYVDNINDIDFSDIQNLYGEDENQNTEPQGLNHDQNEHGASVNNFENQNQENFDNSVQIQNENNADNDVYVDESGYSDDFFPQNENDNEINNFRDDEIFSQLENYTAPEDYGSQFESATQNSSYDIPNIVGGMTKNKSNLASGGVDIVRNEKRPNKGSIGDGIDEYLVGGENIISRGGNNNYGNDQNYYEGRPYEYTSFENEPYLESGSVSESNEQENGGSDNEGYQAKSLPRKTKRTSVTKATKTRTRDSSKISKTTRAKTSRAKSSSTKTRSSDMAKRGRPKKQVIDENFTIKNDSEFESVLSRAEKLMRKSESGLSESQQKRIEKELKTLMDAMNKYKETK